MGFFASGGSATSKKAPRNQLSFNTMHELQCKVCPLNNAPLHNGKMPASGSDEPDVYILGEAPGETEDREGIQFVGKSGDLLWDYIPRDAKVRLNNTIRCHPPKNRNPEEIEIECCRGFIEADIAAHKPKVVIATGLVPFVWLTGFKTAKMHIVRGRRFVMRIGGHPCWVVPVYHPSGLLRQRWHDDRGRLQISLDEIAWRRDMERIFDEYAGWPLPDPHAAADAKNNVYCYWGKDPGDFDTLIRFLDEAAKSKLSGLDLETKQIRPYAKDAKILTKAIAINNKSVAFGWDHPQSKWTPSQREAIDKRYEAYLRSKSRKAVHQLAFEQEWHAYIYGADILRAGLWEDTMSQASVLDERITRTMSPGPLSLEFLVMQHFGFNLKKLYDNLDKNNLDKEPIGDVLLYNGMDAKYHRWLCIRQEDCLDREDLFPNYDVKLRQVPTCVLTQMKGVKIDVKATKDLKDKYQSQVDILLDKINDYSVVKEFERKVKKEFNPGSHHDIERMMRDVIHTNVGRKNTGHYSTEAEVLLAVGHPIFKDIVDWRHKSKIVSTYIEPFERRYPDGMIHCLFGTVLTETGRLQSEDPNMQNQIKRDREAREIRKQIIAGYDEVILAADYGQIEARILAMASRDPVFTEMLWNNYDVHREWALRIAKRCPEWIKGGTYEDFIAGSKKDASKENKDFFKLYRDFAKNKWVFPLFFGAGIGRVSSELELDPRKIEPDRKEFWRIFEGVARWHQKINSFYEKHGFAETLSGHHRRRYPLTYNEMINEPIQGTAAEIVMNAMCRLSETGDPVLQPFLNIHDDLTFRVPLNEVDNYAEKIVDVMLDVQFDWVNVPITVELSYGKSWDRMEDAGTFSSDQWLGWPERNRVAA